MAAWCKRMRYSASSSACTVGATANATEEPSASEASTREPAPSAHAALCTASRAPGRSAIRREGDRPWVCCVGDGMWGFRVFRFAKLKALREPAPQQPGTHSGRYAAVVYTRHGHGISSCQEAVRTQDLRSQAGDRSADVTPLVRRESRRRGHD